MTRVLALPFCVGMILMGTLKAQDNLLKVSKDRRELLMSQAHGTIVGATGTTSLDEGAVPIRFEEYGADSYRIVPVQMLSSGEYALGLRGVITELYCFGVDR